MSMFSWYILLGLCFCLWVEAIVWYITKYGNTDRTTQASKAWNELGAGSRLIMFALWPVSLIVFVVAILKAHFK